MDIKVYYGADHPQAGELKEVIPGQSPVASPPPIEPTKAELLAKVEELLQAVSALK